MLRSVALLLLGSLIIFVSSLLASTAFAVQSTLKTTLAQPAAVSPESISPVNDTIKAQLAAGKLVALGDVHGSSYVVAQLIDFLQHEANWQQVDDIAVEFGNARYQALADRFIVQGDDIAMAEVRHIWRDTLYFMAWQYDVYEQLVLTLRQLNQTRHHKVRLVLAEPALDWRTLTAAGWQQQVAAREQGYSDLIAREIIGQNRSGILLFGTFHFIRQPVTLANGKPFRSVAAMLNTTYPNKLYTLWPRMANDGVAPIAEQQAPYVITLAQAPFGELPFSQISRRIAASESATLAQVADGYHYLKSTARNAPISTAAQTDAAWHRELKRRANIVGGRSGEQINLWLQQHDGAHE